MTTIGKSRNGKFGGTEPISVLTPESGLSFRIVMIRAVFAVAALAAVAGIATSPTPWVSIGLGNAAAVLAGVAVVFGSASAWLSAMANPADELGSAAWRVAAVVASLAGVGAVIGVCVLVAILAEDDASWLFLAAAFAWMGMVAPIVVRPVGN